ncbi:MAG: hypothetical protein LUG87_04760, partial [Oscillospiraceae bacterium]|nr:hypothetical protein [Oscillospiraceae bacterium]
MSAGFLREVFIRKQLPPAACISSADTGVRRGLDNFLYASLQFFIAFSRKVIYTELATLHFGGETTGGTALYGKEPGTYEYALNGQRHP